MQQPPAPFTCTYSPNVPELMRKLNMTLAISTYQAGKLIFLSAVDDERLVQLPRQFDKAMGLAVDGSRLAVATKSEVVVMADAKGLAKGYPLQPNTYDSIFVPRALYYCGEVDLHDMAWGQEGLYAVNTRFSCVSLINDGYSFQPVWQPKFITDLAPEDRCHLNGMVMHEGKPKYVSALGLTDVAKGWRAGVESGGAIIDVDTQDVVIDELAMPHSPRIYDGDLYALLSATGELIKVHTEDGSYDVVAKLNGFARGMAKCGDYLFVGLSKLRRNSSTFRDLPIAQKALECGVEIIHLPSGAKVGQIRYQASVEELYDIQILNGMQRPGIMSHKREEHRLALATPTDYFWSVKQEEQGYNS